MFYYHSCFIISWQKLCFHEINKGWHYIFITVYLAFINVFFIYIFPAIIFMLKSSIPLTLCLKICSHSPLTWLTNAVGILFETRPAYYLRASGFTTGVLVGSVFLIILINYSWKLFRHGQWIWMSCFTSNISTIFNSTKY